MVVNVCWLLRQHIFLFASLTSTLFELSGGGEDDGDKYDGGDGVEESDDDGVPSDAVPGPVRDDRVDPASDDDAVEEVGGKLAPTNPITIILILWFQFWISI